MQKALIVILILGGVAFFVFKKDKTENQIVGAVDESSQTVKEDTFKEKTNLMNLTKRGGDYKCTFSQTTSVGDSNGTVYISGKKIRGDFVSKVSIPSLSLTETVDTYMISDGESVYTWSSMVPDGFKAPVSEDFKSGDSASLNNNPASQELEYTCVSWVVDESVFKIPTNITFKTTL